MAGFIGSKRMSVLRRFFRTSDVAPFDFILAVSIIDFGSHR